MKIEQYLRLELTNNWVSLVKKKKCEICGANKNLEVHHVKQFIVLLQETLALLGLDKKENIEEYSEEELEKIKLIFLGKHMEIKNLTLCTKCHDTIHKVNGTIKIYDKKAIKSEKDQVKLIIYTEKLMEYLNDIVDKKLFKEDIKKLTHYTIDELEKLLEKKKPSNFWEENEMSIDTMKFCLKRRKLPFIVEAKKEEDTESINYGEIFWIVKKIIKED